MSSEMYQRMRANPKFDALVRTRGKFAWTLTTIVLVAFYGFVMVVAFAPQILGRPVAEGATITVGIVAGLSMFVGFWILTFVYVRRANSEFDTLTAELVKEARAAEVAAAAKKEIA